MAASSNTSRKPAASTSRASALSSMRARPWTRACPKCTATDAHSNSAVSFAPDRHAAPHVVDDRGPPAEFQLETHTARHGLHWLRTRARNRLMTKLRPDSNASAAPQSALAERYERVRRMSLSLAAPLSDEDCQVQSMP